MHRPQAAGDDDRAFGAIRRLLAAVRSPTARVGRVAGRLTAVSRYLFDLVLWSRIVARPTELSRRSAAMQRRGVAVPAPRLFVSGGGETAALWEEGFDEVYRLLLANLQTPDLLSRRRYAHPSPAFRGIYLWDSAFISQVWKAWDPLVAIDVCMAVVDQADDDGRLPHVTTHFLESAFTQPPLVAWALRRLHDWCGSTESRAALAQAFEPLVAYADWLDERRRLDGGLYFWAHPYESGVENAPRFSSRDERVLADTTRLAAPDLSAYVVLQSESLAAIARELGRDDVAERQETRAATVRAAMNELLWDERDGVYYDVDVASGAPVRSMTIASLLPLWAGVPDADRARRLLGRVMDPAEFGTTIPLPSVSRADPEFAKDMWRGPTWINTAYGVLLGVERYGFREESAELAARLAAGVYRTHGRTHRVFEFYDPERFDIDELHRKRGNRWKHFTLGSKPRGEFVGWSGLVNTVVVEHLVGFTRERGRAVIAPNIPPRLAGCAFAVRTAEGPLVVEAEAVSPGGSRGVVRSAEGARRFELAPGDRAFVDDLPIEGAK